MAISDVICIGVEEEEKVLEIGQVQYSPDKGKGWRECCKARQPESGSSK